MESFRCYDNSDVIATLMMTNFHLNTTVVAIFPNVCLWRRSLCSDLVLTLKNCIEPPSYARTAYFVAIWPSFLFDSLVKIWATWEIFLGKWSTAPPGKKFPVRLWIHGLLNKGKLELMVDEVVQVHQTIMMQNSRVFFLKISQELGKAWRKSLKRAKRASLTRP